MIRNLLYSILLHLILFSFIYFGLRNVRIVNSIDVQTVSVSLENITKKEEPQIIEEKKVEPEKPKPKEEIKKPKPKPEPKKEIKPKEKIKPKKEPEKPKPKEEKKIEPEKPKEEEKKIEPEKEKKEEIVENLEELQLSSRQKFNIKSQLNSCFYQAFKELNQDLEIEIVIDLKQDGTAIFNKEKYLDLEKYNDPNDKNYKIIMDNIEKAINLCASFRNLPTEKYQVWQKFKLKFVKKAEKTPENDKK